MITTMWWSPSSKSSLVTVMLCGFQRLPKITLNMGVGEAVGDKKIMEHALKDLTRISGQKPVVNLARKSIAGV